MPQSEHPELDQAADDLVACAKKFWALQQEFIVRDHPIHRFVICKDKDIVVDILTTELFSALNQSQGTNESFPQT
jgi:hypothetical protein